MRQHLAHARRYAVSPAFRFRRRLLHPLRDLPKLRRIHPLRRKRSTESKQRRVLLRSGRQVARGDHGTVRHRAPLDGGSSRHSFIGGGGDRLRHHGGEARWRKHRYCAPLQYASTGAILVVIITIFAPICGAHFNPTVSLVMAIRGNLDRREALAYMLVQIVGGCLGALFAHLMSAWIRFSSVLLSEPGCRNGSPSSSPPSGS